MQRRFFLKSGGLAIAGLGLSGMLPGVLQSVAQAAPAARAGAKSKVLVVIFQRGAVDGLNLLVPHGDSAYYAARSSIAVARPGREGGALDLDGQFGLHPALAPLQPFWREQRMAAVHAAGSPDNTRSHFDAQDYMETATPGMKSTRDGWMNRVLQTRAATGTSPFAGVSLTSQTPRSMAGKAATVAMTSLSQFAVQAGQYTGSLAGGFEQMWEQHDAGALGEAGQETFEAVQFLQRSGAAHGQPGNGARYPAGVFGDSLRQLAQLIKADVGLQVGFTESLGWDTHVNQGGANGQLANRLREFGAGIAAFLTDLGPQRDDVLLLTMSEFGRTARENGSRGTDHGHGNVMLAFGAPVRGGKVYGQWPGLSASQLYEGRDLAVTTDFRDVLGEVTSRHLGNEHLAQVFPGYASDPARFRGLLRA